MREEELYYQEDMELDTIDAFKELLKEYPTNLIGWSRLATMQNKITDFDGAIASINKAIEIAPQEAPVLHQKCMILSLILRYPSEGQTYFNDQTREAYDILSYETREELILDLISLLTKLIQLGQKDKMKYRLLWKLAINYRRVGENKDAIHQLFEAEKLIPLNYNEKKRNRELANINREISSNYSDQKEYALAIQFLNTAFEFGLDDFKHLLLVDIYAKMGETEKELNVLKGLLSRINQKLVHQPVAAYIFQKLKVLKRLKNTAELKKLTTHFDDIPQNEYNLKEKKKIEEEVNAYLQEIKTL